MSLPYDVIRMECVWVWGEFPLDGSAWALHQRLLTWSSLIRLLVFLGEIPTMTSSEWNVYWNVTCQSFRGKMKRGRGLSGFCIRDY